MYALESNESLVTKHQGGNRAEPTVWTETPADLNPNPKGVACFNLRRWERAP